MGPRRGQAARRYRARRLDGGYPWTRKGSGYTTFTDAGAHNRLAAGTSYHIPLRMCLNAQVPNLGVVGVRVFHP